MKILYVFPHPDDESFGPGPAIAADRREGHEVHLLTLTRGGATKVRHTLGYSVDQMGAARLAEMRDVERVLDLSSLEVLDLPDSGLKELDPREIEAPVREVLARVQPHVLVTYAVHGVSGFHDHLVTHAAVKRVFVETGVARRLALFTLTDEAVQKTSGPHRLSASTAEEIDCVVAPTEADVQLGQRALDCYVTYAGMIEKTGVRRALGPVAFEWYREQRNPVSTSLVDGL